MTRRGSAAAAFALAAAAAALAAAETHDAANVAACALAAAALVLAPRAPRQTCALTFVACVATLPVGTSVSLAIVAAGHAFWVARREQLVVGAGATLALLGVVELGAAWAPGSWTFVPQLGVLLAAWAGGRALHEREAVITQLDERRRELEQERELHATLSVRYERARIASELHDIVGHAMSVMVVQAAAGQRLAACDPALADETFATIAGAARQAESDMQRLVALLADQDSTADAPDLALVEELVGHAAGSGLDVALRLEGDRDALPAPVAELAYRVVQEGLTNALRYAAGARVTVSVCGQPRALDVTVANGPAAREAALEGAGSGSGLRGLRERADAVGGRVECGRAADGGWRLHAHLPR